MSLTSHPVVQGTMPALINYLEDARLIGVDEQSWARHGANEFIVKIGIPIPATHLPVGVPAEHIKTLLAVAWSQIVKFAVDHEKLIKSGVDPTKLDELAEVARALRTLKKVLS